jgi:hypothetical protein
MRRNVGARLKSIEEALHSLFMPMEIVISPLSGRGLGFATDLRKEFGRQEFRHRAPQLLERALEVTIPRDAGITALTDIEQGTTRNAI